jgi:hypothetical protein
MNVRTAGLLFLLAVGGPWLVLFSTNGLMAPPATAYQLDRCTRYCHDKGCRHDASLPDAMAGRHGGRQGLYGKTIEGLVAAGSRSSLGNKGYKAVNLLLFCVVWPGSMLVLLGTGLYQRVLIGRQRSPS